MSQFLHRHDCRWRRIYTKSAYTCTKFKLWHIAVNYKNILKGPSFPGTFTQKEEKNGTKQMIWDKTLYFQNNNLRQSWKFYNTAGGDGGDIKKVWSSQANISDTPFSQKSPGHPEVGVLNRHRHLHRPTNRQTDGHCDSMKEST